jgi:hypothetical protein
MCSPGADSTRASPRRAPGCVSGFADVGYLVVVAGDAVHGGLYGLGASHSTWNRSSSPQCDHDGSLPSVVVPGEIDQELAPPGNEFCTLLERDS